MGIYNQSVKPYDVRFCLTQKKNCVVKLLLIDCCCFPDLYFLQDIVVGLVLAILLNASGVLGAYMANEWSKVLELGNGVTEARNSLAALCVSVS